MATSQVATGTASPVAGEEPPGLKRRENLPRGKYGVWVAILRVMGFQMQGCFDLWLKSARVSHPWKDPGFIHGLGLPNEAQESQAKEKDARQPVAPCAARSGLLCVSNLTGAQDRELCCS